MYLSCSLIFKCHTIIYNRLYFSAHWCPPCRKFTPILATAYNAHDLSSRDGNTGNDVATTADEIEVIFISLDSVKSEYDAYRSNMPWLLAVCK